MITPYRGYLISYDRWEGFYTISQRGEDIERADTIADAKTKIDTYFEMAV